jgi:purine-binding chemotaxis protein CheW
MTGLSFIADGGLYCVEVDKVERIVRNMEITPVPTAPDAIMGIGNLKGRVVTIFNLCELLENTSTALHSTESIRAIIIKAFTDGEDQIGLCIDKSGELIEIDDEAIVEPSHTDGFCISGITDIDDELYRIIDVDSIINKYKDIGGSKNVEMV